MIDIVIERVQGDHGFEAKDSQGHTLHLDSSPESGGSDYGVRPMQSLLMGLGGCSGIDIVSILLKQRLTIEAFVIRINGRRERDKIPSLWESIHIIFELTGNIEQEKAERACDLSINKYCSVAETLRR